MLRFGSLVAIQNEGGLYSILEVAREHAELNDIISWERIGVDLNCLNETHGRHFIASFREGSIIASGLFARLRALGPQIR